jgi:uncharacterized membrane protein YjgN (DUF898 family)
LCIINPWVSARSIDFSSSFSSSLELSFRFPQVSKIVAILGLLLITMLAKALA